jgi:uncharacterized membrane protein YraQ (UPF0718 family)
MHSVLTFIANGFKGRAFLMAWEVWGALVFGFAIYAIVQAWGSPRAHPERAGRIGLSACRARTRSRRRVSLCIYAEIAIAKSLVEKGASAASALAFQFGSTNLVIEIGIAGARSSVALASVDSDSQVCLGT